MISRKFDILKYATVIPMKRQVCRIRGHLSGELVAREGIDINEHFATGIGHSSPLGIIHAPDVPRVSRENQGRVCLQDCIDMLAIFHAIARTGQWVFSPTAYAQFGRDVDCEFHQVDIKNGHLFGMQIFVHHKSPELGQSGDVILANFSNYVIGQYKLPPSQYPDDGESYVLYDGYPGNVAVSPVGTDRIEYNFVILGEVK